MRALSKMEVEEVSGAGWMSFLLPIVVGFCFGGPAGAVAAAGVVVTQAGVKNLEHLNKKGEIPTFEQIVN